MNPLWMCLLVLMMRDMMTLATSSPAMTFTGTMVEINDSALFHFVCETSAVFLGCAVNFLKNGRSQESIRYDSDHNACYHSNALVKGLCIPEICSCSGCHKFIWNYTLNPITNIDNLSFECEGNIFANPKKFKGSAVLQLTKNKFIKLKPNITEYGRQQVSKFPLVTKSIIKSTTTLPKKGKDKTLDTRNDHGYNDSVYTLLVVITVVAVLILIILVIPKARKIKKWFTQKKPTKQQPDQANSEELKQLNKVNSGNHDEIEQTDEHRVAEIVVHRPDSQPSNNDVSSNKSFRHSSDTLNNPSRDDIHKDDEAHHSSCSEIEVTEGESLLGSSAKNEV